MRVLTQLPGPGKTTLLKLLFILTAYYGVVQAAFGQAHTRVFVVSDWAVRSGQDVLPHGHLCTFQKPQTLPSECQPSPAHSSAAGLLCRPEVSASTLTGPLIL